MNISIEKIQSVLQDFDVDAWAMYDFRGANSIAWSVLGLEKGAHCTRRWIVLIPKAGPARKIVSRIERHTLEHIDAEEILYSSRQEWTAALEELVKVFPKLAMEYSPNNDIPVASKVDGGTIEYLRSLGAEISSSADISQHFSSVMSEDEHKATLKGAKLLRECMQSGMAWLRIALLDGRTVTEYEVQQHILNAMDTRDLETDHAPIVAVGPHAANPHYAPSKDFSAPIRENDVLLFDMWALPKDGSGFYSDITWMAFAGQSVPERPAQLFDVIARGRDAIIEHLQANIPAGNIVKGFELDDIARNIVADAGYADAFVHRTGHNITRETHGPGVNLDNFETHDTRSILPGISFSIEPGIYLKDDIGLRTEVDIVISPDKEVIVTGGNPQKAIIPLTGEKFDITDESY